jgi:hypothetical protein
MSQSRANPTIASPGLFNSACVLCLVLKNLSVSIADGSRPLWRPRQQAADLWDDSHEAIFLRVLYLGAHSSVVGDTHVMNRCNEPDLGQLSG